MVGWASRDSEGRFRGSRVNAESVPRLPAWAARAVLADPRGIPYLLAWTNARGDLLRAERLSRFAPNPDEPPFDAVEVREPRTQRLILVNYRAMPRSRGVAMFLVCPDCKRLRRFLYGKLGWVCRSCAQLRYSSEGVYLPAWERRCGLGALPHDGPWDPLVRRNLTAELSDECGFVAPCEVDAVDRDDRRQRRAGLAETTRAYRPLIALPVSLFVAGW